MSLLGNPTNALITSSGGYVYPAVGTAGFLQQSTNIPYFQGTPQVGNIAPFMRDYNMRDMLVKKIQEGRVNMMRVLLAQARMGGAWIVNDVKPTFKLDYKPTPRFYLKVKTNQGGTKTSTYTTSTFVLANAKDAKRLQIDDLIVLNFAYVNSTKDCNSVALDYTTASSTSVAYVPLRSPSYPIQEQCKVLEVDYTAGTVKVLRNIGNDARTAARQGMAIDVATNATTDPGVNIVYAQDAFFVRSGNTKAAGTDDQTIYNRVPTWDYNTCQYVMRKWGSQDIESAIYKAYPGFENTHQKNRVEMIEDLYEELEFMFLYGARNEDYDARGRWSGTMGGFFEFVPASNYIQMEEPDYTDPTKMGDFTINRLNQMLAGKFYYGSQSKILVCGERWHTAFSTMLNMKTSNLPFIVDRWDVKGFAFQSSNGGQIFVTPSDTLSLNGNNDIAILMDPETFQYGHLNGFDLNVVDPLPTNNIHEKEGEVYGVVTCKRSNPAANYVFTLKPNAGG
jgi:hypothetical protein